MEICGQAQNKHLKRAGKYLLGLPLEKNSVKALTNCIAREDGTENFRVLRILNLVEEGEVTQEEIQKAKNIIQKEVFLLQLLEGEPGILRQYGVFRDTAVDENNVCFPRIFSVVDCYVPHDFSPEYSSYTNLYFYMKEMKRISEEEAIRLFLQCLRIVVRVHNMNVVHRDLTLSNFVLDKKTGQIQLANFGMGSLLTYEEELLQIQPGSPLYFSPDIIAAQPYLGKPTDMWSMGVVFYGLLFSEFPFYGCNLPSLYKKIGAMSYSFPVNKEASPRSLRVLKGIFKRSPSERLTCEQVIDELLTAYPDTSSDLQVVPSTEEEKETKKVAKAPEVTWVMPVSYDRNGEIPLKYSEVMRYHQHMFSKQNPPITAVS